MFRKVDNSVMVLISFNSFNLEFKREISLSNVPISLNIFFSSISSSIFCVNSEILQLKHSTPSNNSSRSYSIKPDFNEEETFKFKLVKFEFDVERVCEQRVQVRRECFVPFKGWFDFEILLEGVFGRPKQIESGFGSLFMLLLNSGLSKIVIPEQ